jgi:D-alanine-D-alanine ligase
MRVAVLHNAVPEDAPLEDQDTLVQVRAVVEALARLGHESLTVSCTLDLAALHDELRRLRPDVVFNVVESLAGADSLGYLPSAVLDVLGVPYTGNRTEALFLTTHKLLAKQQLRQAGLPTPGWMESKKTIHEEHEGHKTCQEDLRQDPETKRCDPGPNPSHLSALSSSSSCPSCPSWIPNSVPSSSSLSSSRSSWIIKGIWEQGSRGMDDDAVLHDVDPVELRRRLAERATRSGRPCFAEQYVEGREFNLSVLAGPAGPQVLSPAEIDFSAFPPGKPRIVGHRAKWQADSFEFHHTPRCFDFPSSDGPLLDRLRSLAEQCWMLFGLRGWARVDFRVDAAGQPLILEINANPCLSPDAGFAAALGQAAIPFDQAVRRILEDS